MKRKIAMRNNWGRACLTACCMAGAALMGLTSCAGDDDPAPEPFKPQLPGAGGSPLRAVRHHGDVMSCYDWELGYEAGRLTTATGTLRDPDAANDGSFSYTSAFTYGANHVAMTASSGEQISMTLNASGYVEKMSVNRNEYYFSYTDGRLAAWTKTVVESSVGQIVTYKSSATITYDNGNLARIVYTGVDNVPVTLTFTPSVLPNRNGLLPEAVGRELGCIGFEQLYYAGLLGRPTVNLVKSVAATGYTDASKNFTIDFDYSTQSGNTGLCTYHTPTGGLVSVTYGY